MALISIIMGHDSSDVYHTSTVMVHGGTDGDHIGHDSSGSE